MQAFKRKSGGIGIYVRNNIAPFIDVIPNDSEYILWISIKKEFTHLDENIILGAVYLPPENSRFFTDDHFNSFENEISQKCNDYKYVYLAGDTNSRTGTLRDYIRSDSHLNEILDIDLDLQTQLDKHIVLQNQGIPLDRASMDNRSNTHGFRLLDICKNNNIFILNGRLFSDHNKGVFTFRDKSVIDYAIASAECFQNITNFEILETDTLFSDGHSALSWEINISNNQNFIENTRLNSRPSAWKPEMENVFKQNIDVQKINMLNLQLNTYPVSQETVDKITNELQSIFQSASLLTYPSKNKIQFNNNSKPWFGPKCYQARKNYHNAKDEYIKSRSNDNKLRLRNASKLYKRTMNFYIKRYKDNRSKTLRTLNEKSPKLYWKFLNNLKPKGKNTPTPSIQDFYEHFKAININTINDDRFTDELITSQHSNLILNSKITEAEILKCIVKLKNSKAPSPVDNIINEYIKATKVMLLPIYCKLFNCVFDTGFLPNSWLEGMILPIYKNKGDAKDPNNYRPITILSCLGKLFTAVLNQRLTNFLESYNILDENQAGFRKGYSCFDHIFTLYALIEIFKQRKQKLFCCFIDFSQAFDKVWRAGLWQKLLQNSVNGKFFTVITNMYKNIKSCVSLKGSISPFFMSDIGVRQGENLSPVLFSLFLNDLQSNMHINGSVGVELKDPIDLTLWLKLLILLYADDTVLLSDSPTDFQNSLNLFNNYCNNWHLNINLEKTKILIFGARQFQNFDFKIGDRQIEITNNYHYLGLTFSSNGSFLKARKHLAEQANKALHLLFTRANNAELPIDLVIKLFDHTVLPILTYGSEIFGFENVEILEKVHNNFLRKITNARRSTPMTFLYGELGRYPISIIIKSRMISFWNRLILGKEQKLSFQIYKYIINQPTINVKWCNKIKEILNSVGRPDLWQNQFQINQQYIHRQVKQTLIDQYKQSWHEELQISNKSRIYYSFKDNHEFEKYFFFLTKQEYNNLFKFRTANHHLPIETGRYDGTPLDDRKCFLCNNGHIGSEQHYLLECNFFQNERDRYLGTFLAPVHNRSMKTILSSSSAQVLKQVCKFVRIIMDKFKR
jgi:hypothetical protein